MGRPPEEAEVRKIRSEFPDGDPVVALCDSWLAQAKVIEAILVETNFPQDEPVATWGSCREPNPEPGAGGWGRGRDTMSRAIKFVFVASIAAYGYGIFVCWSFAEWPWLAAAFNAPLWATIGAGYVELRNHHRKAR